MNARIGASWCIVVLGAVDSTTCISFMEPKQVLRNTKYKATERGGPRSGDHPEPFSLVHQHAKNLATSHRVLACWPLSTGGGFEKRDCRVAQPNVVARPYFSRDGRDVLAGPVGLPQGTLANAGSGLSVDVHRTQDISRGSEQPRSCQRSLHHLVTVPWPFNAIDRCVCSLKLGSGKQWGAVASCSASTLTYSRYFRIYIPPKDTLNKGSFEKNWSSLMAIC